MSAINDIKLPDRCINCRFRFYRACPAIYHIRNPFVEKRPDWCSLGNLSDWLSRDIGVGDAKGN